MSHLYPSVTREQIAQFLKDNPELLIVKETIKANKNKDTKAFWHCIKTIDRHIHAIETIKASHDYWDECGCADCNMWREQYEEMLIVELG